MITEAHEDQIRNMREDKKTYAEIREFFQDTYKIKLYDSEIARVMRGQKVHHRKTHKVASRRIASRKAKEQTPIKAEASGDFALHIHAAYDIHKKDFVTRVEAVLATI